MKKETVHIVSHSHWDREWYLPLEEHRMRLVELFDDLFNLFETDPEFKSFHLDGQLIVLEDYLKIRPQNEEKLKRYIAEGRLIVGPFYILQDDFLITSETNMRNTLVGHVEGKKWGQMPQIGYFPDTFGNMGQAPQLLQQAGIDVAFFGRGVQPVGFDNQVLPDNQYHSTYSEMIWEGADGSQVLGILFANWYSNGNEIPVDEEMAKEYWDKKLADVRKYASTSQYLMMNGCDHQPVQKDLTKALQTAQSLYPDINFVHSTLEDYVRAVRAELPEDMSVIKGELTSQETDGWYTLANTASTRIHLKQENDKSSDLLEHVVEPLIVMTQGEVPRDELRYAWKLLLENAPHDSICACSIDNIDHDMSNRYAKVQQVGRFLCQRALENWEKKLDTSKLDGYLFTIINTSAEKQTQKIAIDITIDKRDFRDGQLEKHYQDMQDIVLPELAVYNTDHQEVAAQITDLGVSFHYDLPRDKFRSATFARKVRVTMVVEGIAPFSWKTYQLKAGVMTFSDKATQALENGVVSIVMNDKRQLVWSDKRTGKEYPEFLKFEDTGDLGNEYVQMAPRDEPVLFSELVSFELLPACPGMKRGKLVHRLMVPKEMAETLKDEQERIVEFKNRTSKRSTELEELLIETEICLYDHSPQVQFRSRFTNTMKDHRLRVLLDLGVSSNSHRADSIYETVVRSNHPHPSWENPSHPYRHRTFIALSDEENVMTVSSKGLHEYEILDGQTVALTILRAVGEMGDWGYFPAHGGQCLREYEVGFALELQAVGQFYATVHRAQAFQTDLLATQVSSHTGAVSADGVALIHPVLEEERFCVTSLKVAEEHDSQLLRYYNLSYETVPLDYQAQGVDLLEQPIGLLSRTVRGQEIRTEIIGERS
ncbi:alpha-mannosidase [Streptococcus merionis]|uniref:alpha-mannosidase n=1 Tax=Streptococcus merionis TaxID=400065 RepID=UPI0026EFC13B|nr:alpha-mannosidase [Streptococcus merionis]